MPEYVPMAWTGSAFVFELRANTRPISTVRALASQPAATGSMVAGEPAGVAARPSLIPAKGRTRSRLSLWTVVVTTTVFGVTSVPPDAPCVHVIEVGTTGVE